MSSFDVVNTIRDFVHFEVPVREGFPLFPHVWMIADEVRRIALIFPSGRGFEAMLQQLTPQQHRRYNGRESRTLMCFFRFLVISILTSASIAPLTAQTKQQIKQLPRGCAYMGVPVLENPFHHPAQKDGINMTRVVAPSQFRVHTLPSPSKNLLSPVPLFAEPPSGFIMVCGLHLDNL